MKHPTIYIPVSHQSYLDKVCLGSAGPRPNITGMRKIYGKDAPLIKCGLYLYRVTPEVYNEFV